ncbi:MAG TPA: hypothetical protein VGF57_09660 [Roseiarcus sp.]|jgi:hypothetical protein
MRSALHDRIEFGEASERAGVDNMFCDRSFCDFDGSEGYFGLSSLSGPISCDRPSQGCDRHSQGCCEQRKANGPDGQGLNKGCGSGVVRAAHLSESLPAL